jgi:hypothetical protein
MKKHNDQEDVQTVSGNSTSKATLSSGEDTSGGARTSDAVESLKDQIDLEERYGIDPDTNNIEGAQLRHPNRNLDKTGSNKRTAKSTASRAGRKRNEANSTNAALPEEITNLSKDYLAELANFKSEMCVSVYLPHHRTEAVTTGGVDAILFKTLLQQCERTREGDEASLLARTLAPAYQLVKNEQFWNAQTAGGLAFFIADGYFKFVRLRSEPVTHTLVNNSFLVSPLLEVALNPDYFYLLVISKKQSKLFRGDKFGLTYVPVPEMPKGIEDVVHLEEKDDENLFRSGSSGGGGGAVYHGTGSTRPDDKENIAMYLAEVDNTIRKEVLRDSTAPLLLASVGYIIPIYKKVTHYNNVWEAALTGNREFESDSALHAEAMGIMGEYFERPKQQALAEYGNKSGTNLTSTNLDDIVRAAHYKRIDTLFVNRKAQLWGSFDDAEDLLIVHASEIAGDDNLIDKTVLKTVLAGGKVYMLDEAEMPVNRMMVAVMRYE